MSPADDPQRPTTSEATWPRVGEQLAFDPPLEVEVSLPAEPGSRRYLTRSDTGVSYELHVFDRDDHPSLLHRERAREALATGVLLPHTTEQLHGLTAHVTQLPDVPTLYDGLVEAITYRDTTSALRIVQRWIGPLLDFLEDHLHMGVFFGGLDPRDTIIDTDGTCRLRRPPQFYGIDEGPAPPGLRSPVEGFSAPEVYGHCGGRLDPRTDVFFVGVTLYYLLARVAPIAEASDPMHRLPPANIFHEDVPGELSAVARRAASPIPGRRYRNVVEMRDALTVALDTIDRRANEPSQQLQLDVGHELHIGVLKGQYAPTNQDDLFLAYHGDSQVGLFVVTDGVSISEYGSGDLASTCVRQASLETWHAIANGAYGEIMSDGATLEPGDLWPKLPADDAGRRTMVRRLLDNANRRIAERIHRDIPEFTAPAEGIMAATAVVVVLERDQALLGWIGDSRIYLVRDGHLATLNTEHSLEMQLLRLGRTPTAAREAPAARALVRCVGEFRKDGTRLSPVALQPEFRTLRILPGDTLVMCSDGVPDYGGIDEEAAEQSIMEIVEAAPGAPWAAFELMVLPNRGGGGDNVSCIVLRFDRPGAGYGV